MQSWQLVVPSAPLEAKRSCESTKRMALKLQPLFVMPNPSNGTSCIMMPLKIIITCALLSQASKELVPLTAVQSESSPSSLQSQRSILTLSWDTSFTRQTPRPCQRCLTSIRSLLGRWLRMSWWHQQRMKQLQCSQSLHGTSSCQELQWFCVGHICKIQVPDSHLQYPFVQTTYPHLLWMQPRSGDVQHLSWLTLCWESID